MPKIIDHDAKKLEIGNVILNYIAQYGVNDLTVRKLSKFGGFSTGVLSHYFSDKQEMLNWACSIHIQQIKSRILKKFESQLCAYQQLEIVIQELLAIENDTPEMIVPIYFWTAILHEDSLRQYLLESYLVLREFLGQAFELGIKQKKIKPELDVNYEIDRILALTDGFLIAWNVDKKRFDISYKKEVVKKLTDELIERIALS
ncbi:TetR/AcrR family transcriptional regulator [Acinetobacter baumannii]|uniref:TetR/AcrR family transcriptional regulator n=1 Tax=Acinetobacter baumannii TaxID=470 RepID=UPI00135FB099|nr:TetR family transcriptional regulator C-terminal domain-containing protein [Acinetobacter baumannii]CAA0160494.1 repressor of bet genes [Acinetobacter baumannii]